MTTKYLTGAYPGGYTLSDNYNALVIEASASIGGTGLLVQSFANVENLGTVTASGYAVILSSSGEVANGAANNVTAQLQGVELRSFGDVSNYATISCTVAGVRLNEGGSVTNGSAGDTRASIISTHIGVDLFGGGNTAISLTNFGTIVGSTGAILYDRFTYCTLVNGSQTDRHAIIQGTSTEAIYDRFQATINNYGTLDGRIDVHGGTLSNSGLITSLVSGVGKIANAGTIAGSAYLASGGLVVAELGGVFGGGIYGAGGALELASGAGTISGLGATGTLSGAVAGTFNDFGRYSVDSSSSWTLAGTNTLTSGKTLTVDGAVTNTGTLTVDWTISGTGSLVCASGPAAINKGGSIGTAGWSLTGGVTTINEFLDYSGNFSETAGATLTVASGAHLYLLGSSMLSGTINGTQTVSVSDATLSDLLLGGKVHLRVTGNALQTGEVTVGDSGATGAQLIVDKGTAYTMQGPVSIAQGASTKSQLEINGNLIRSGAAGVSVVAVATLVDGTVKVDTGTLDFSNQLTGTGSLLIHSGATLQADRSAASSLTVVFGKGRDALALTKPSAFAATLSGFNAGDVIDLLGLHATGASVDDSDQLVIVNGLKTVATLQLSGSYAGATFQAASDGNGGTDITLVSAPSIPATRTAAGGSSVPALITAMASLGGRAAFAMNTAAHGEMFKPVLLASKV